MRSETLQSEASNPNQTDETLVTLPQAARRLGISNYTARQMARRGQLPMVLTGRRLRVPSRALRDLVRVSTHVLAEGAAR